MSIPLRVKICGVTQPDDVRLCAETGADAVGVNFHPDSPRYVDPRQAMPLLKAIPPLMAGVGVFVAQPMRQVCALAYQLGLRGVQWHGENPETADPFPFALIAAFRIKDQAGLTRITNFLAACAANGHQPAAILVDAFVEGQMGGTGHKAPWDLLADFRPSVPLILAGGLTPENVGEAIRLVRPAAVDVASGVESSPGRKDPDKVRRFIANAREAAASL
ncbi:MAG: phosphoribosylanthranilate isomerase [Planctomycetes bacterium]|nr:phosphoribosylanthranilate isomerase [Planctomycetota bacterium]